MMDRFTNCCRRYDDKCIDSEDRIALFVEMLSFDDVFDVSGVVFQDIAEFRYRNRNNTRLLQLLEEALIDYNLPSSIYDDRQNTHSFTEEARHAAKYLISTYLLDKESCLDHHPTVMFIRGKMCNDIDLYSLYKSIVCFANGRHEIIERLREELDEAQGTCMTGHLTRLVNALSGFTDEPLLRMNDYDYQKGLLFHRFNKLVIGKHDRDDILSTVLSSLSDDEKTNPIISRIVDEYTGETNLLNF